MVPPYSITTLSPAEDSNRHQHHQPPRAGAESPHTSRHTYAPGSGGGATTITTTAVGRESPLGGGGYGAGNSVIPPPAILSQHSTHQQQQQQRGGVAEAGIYYSTPSELVEKKQQRMLTKEGVFVSCDANNVRASQASLDSNSDGLRTRMEGEYPSPQWQ